MEKRGKFTYSGCFLKKNIYINGKTDEVKNALEFTVISQTTTCT